MKQIIFFVLLFLLCSIQLSIAQVTIPDSIATFLSQKSKSVQFIDHLNDLAFKCLKSNNELGLALALQSTKFSKEIDYAEGYASAIDIVGSSYWMIGDYENALKYYQFSANESRLNNDTTTLLRAYNNIAEVYKKINEYDKAIDLLTISSKWHTKYKQDAIVLYNIGEAYLFKQDFLKALDYYNQALTQAIKEDNSRTIAYCYQGLGTIKYKNKEFYAALAYLTQSENLWTSQGEFRQLVQNHKDHAEVFISLGQFNKAEHYINKAIDLANKIKAHDLQINNFLKASELYAIEESFNKAYEFLGKHNSLKDSLYNLKKTESINRMQAVFDSEARSQENRQLKEAQSLKDSKIKSQQLLIVAVSVGLLIAGILAFSLYQQRHNIAKVNEILKIKTVEIQLQKGEIEVQALTLNNLNSQLTDLNKSLESRIQERTGQLIQQNEKLAKYVHANAHQLRAPVVSILGLLNLLDNVHLQSDDKILIVHLLKCGKELDTITRTINQNLEAETATNKEGKI